MPRPTGFTLIELLVTIAIISILLGLAAPSLGELAAEASVTAERDRLMRSLGFARQNAVFFQRSVSLCPGDESGCAGDGRWENGWLVFTDPNRDKSCTDADRDGFCDGDGGKILRVEPSQRSQLTLRGNHWVGGGITFDLNGRAGLNNGTFSICPLGQRARPRAVLVANTGRPRAAAPGLEANCP